MTSHIPEAVNSAQILKMVMKKARISENPRLSRYHAGSEKRFLKDFLGFVSYFPDMEHIVLVSHNHNITNLTNRYIPRGANLTLEAPSWEEMFNLRACSISIAAERLTRLGIEQPNSWEELLSAEEKKAIDELSFVLS
ncbi:MAG: hypothetical protein NC218_09940 [Acetobacter sp.]|nr:hypothetical protein [Acetobacter sp.]